MNRIICLIAAILTMAFSLPFTQAETVSLSREKAIAIMDAIESLDFDETWESKEFQKENARRKQDRHHHEADDHRKAQPSLPSI